MLSKQLEFIVKGAKTRRYHTNGTIPPESVAEHSFMVAWLVALLYAQTDPELLQSAMCFALAHDLAEGQVGDVASPVKKANPKLKEMLDYAEEAAWESIGKAYPCPDDRQKYMVKMADNMAGLLYCADLIRNGNKDAVEIYENFHSYIMGMGVLKDNEIDVLVAIERRVSNVG